MNVTDNLRDTYHHITGRGVNGYLYEPPSDSHGGIVHHMDPTKSHEDAVAMFSKHITDHGGESVAAYSRKGKGNTMIMYQDNGQSKLAHVSTNEQGGHRLELGYGGW